MITALSVNDSRVTGRLGNQLFVIAAAVALAKRHNDDVFFPEWNYLPYFEHSLPVSNQLQPSQFQDYIEPHFHFTSIPYHPFLNLKGYFQSEKYFSDQQNAIRTLFTPHYSLRQALSKRYESRLEKSISLHIRRGDYIALKGHHPPLPLSYYTEALEQCDKEASIFIFSDDIPWCRKAFHHLGEKALFIENQPDIADMFLMSMCTQHIIANSSFSWWGAWLNSNLTKKVIAPAPWFGPKKDLQTHDLIPESWTLLPWTHEKKSWWKIAW
jgi:hypothetical protein